ncbi:pleckstrin homology (PH) domain-containing protein [Striga asiatica]|uniref:Pleckstrin homology (PH) domain-containing protein n=1 Tax=Striga asiatica TaxID=4170 RepID=A0A5A7PRQ2_STRAF|nr:pleckstrin homology (PH) domain-containing protein [Striga asiatica]
MLEDQVAYLLQRYLGNYVRGLSKEALKISVWQGDVELTNMQLKPEALNALKLPVKVKAGFLGSVKLKVPWSRLGQDPVLVYLDRIFLLAEPSTQVEGSTEDSIQEVKKNRIREMEMKLLESQQLLNSEMNKSWIGSLINTVIGNLKLSISNIHIRYEDIESNPGHAFAAGVMLDKLSAFTVDDNGEETFITGGALDRIQKSVQLERMAIYLDSDVSPWHIEKAWEDLSPSEWGQIFEFGTKGGKPAADNLGKHSYVLEPVSGNAKYSKERSDASRRKGQPLQNAAVNLDDVTLCLSKAGYHDLLKLADNFTAFNQRLYYAHYRPHLTVKSDPRSWWKYAFRAVMDKKKKASGMLSWEQVLRYAKLRKRYISLMLAHKVVEQSLGSEKFLKEQKAKKSWWPFGRTTQTSKDENEPGTLTEEDWKRLNDIIGYKEGDDEQLLTHGDGNLPYISLSLHMKHNASKLTDSQECLADLSCDNLECCINLYPEAKIVDIKLGSYRLLSPNGLLAVSEIVSNSLVAVFCYKPLDMDVDWSLVAKASPCYVTYLKDSINQIIDFFESSATVSETLVRETASAVQMTIDEVKRTATKQVNRALKERARLSRVGYDVLDCLYHAHTDYLVFSLLTALDLVWVNPSFHPDILLLILGCLEDRFFLDLDIAAPKITIPTEFSPDGVHPTRLLIDLGKLVIRSQDNAEYVTPEEMNVYSQFDLVLRDVSAFLVDGDYRWNQASLKRPDGSLEAAFVSYLPVIDRCAVFLKLQQIISPVASFPSTRLAMRLPSIGIHFSPSRYHRLMQVVKLFQGDDADHPDLVRPWDEADFSGWLYQLARKGVGGRDAVWQRRYFCVVGPLLYVLKDPESRNYKQCYSLRGKHLYRLPSDLLGDVEHVLAVGDSESPYVKVVEDANSVILRCGSESSLRTWQSYLQGAIYRASGTATLTGLIETLSNSESSEPSCHDSTNSLMTTEKLFLTGVLDELKISFSYCSMRDQSFMKMLLADEKLLKALEVEDLVCRKGTSQLYIARSFITNIAAPSLLENSVSITHESSDVNQSEGDDEFYEAPEDLNDLAGSPMSPDDEMKGMSSGSITQSENNDSKAPSFTRVAGVLPRDATRMEAGQEGVTDALGSFVKAQIIIFDQHSPLYSSVDTKVAVTLSTLSFYCRRPTILAIMEFVNSINIQEDECEPLSDTSSTSAVQHDTFKEIPTDGVPSVPMEERVVKSLLGKGKSRVVFYLRLNMARAEIFLVMEDENKLATLAQDNLLTDIKVFPSSFSIKAFLGNLRISDDSLPSSHTYFWACDMRNPGGNSFVELKFCSFSANDDDYEGYDYSLFGKLSEVRIVYLNRFLQEVISYFMGLVPANNKDVVQIEDQVTNSQKWITRSEIEGSPAVKLNVSLKKPIIVMPQRTNSLDYLKLDVVQITVQNTCRWFGGSKSDIKAVHMDILEVRVEDINLNVGSGSELGESIIQNVKGVSIVIQRSLQYEIIIECAQANISESPNFVPSLENVSVSPFVDVGGHTVAQGLDHARSETQAREIVVATVISVRIDMVELRLHYGVTTDASLAILQVSGVWLLYKSNTVGEGSLSATLKDLIVVDDREGTEKELRLAIRKPDINGDNFSGSMPENVHHDVENNLSVDNARKYTPAILIFDATFNEKSTFLSLCIQRPQLLVALDFLLAIVEFFVPTFRGEPSDENANPSHFLDALILDQPVFNQPSAEFSISPEKPLVVDDERFDLFVYDGRGGILYLKDRQGLNLSSPSREALVYVGNGKKLQFRNVTVRVGFLLLYHTCPFVYISVIVYMNLSIWSLIVQNGTYFDSCILLGANSSYSANEKDNVYLEGERGSPSDNSEGRNITAVASANGTLGGSTELIFELQAIGPELTFYNKSRNTGQHIMSNKLLHAQMDTFCRLVLKGNTVEMSTEVVDLTMESNGITILEPFDASIKFSSASGKTSLQLNVSDIFMNFSFSILRLFLAVEEDILSILRTTSKKSTVLCSEFDRIGTIKSPVSDHVYAFWRPRAPTGFAVLGDYLTPIDKPPTKGVVSVNTSLIRVKKPKSFTLVWPHSFHSDILQIEGLGSFELAKNEGSSDWDTTCSIWLPEAPKGYVALGCVVSSGWEQPSISSVFCISASLVSPCGLRDCVSIGSGVGCPDMAFWRVDNAFGTFLPADPATMNLTQGAYELRQLYFRLPEISPDKLIGLEKQTSTSAGDDIIQSERSSTVNSRRRIEAVATFRLIWWNQGSGSRKKISIWRPVVPEGMVYFGDIAVQGYEPPNTCVVFQESEDNDLFIAPSDFQPVGHVKRQRKVDTISFWMPQAPPGFVTLGCTACKGKPKQSDFISLRCIRADMVSTDHFLDQSVWDLSDSKFVRAPFSIWTVGNEFGTFIVGNGLKKPPKRFALKLSGRDTPSSSDDTVVDAEIRTFSAALFDDYGGLDSSTKYLGSSGDGLHGRPDFLKSSVIFSLAVRSYNDKYDSWEPIVEPVDGSLRGRWSPDLSDQRWLLQMSAEKRYQYNPSAPGVASELRVASTRDLNLNLSVSNANTILQAYASWNNLSHVQETHEEASPPDTNSGSLTAVHQKRSYYIVPQNKLGKDIFIRASAVKGLLDIIKMPAGDRKALKLPAPKNMLDSHLKGCLLQKRRMMVTVIVAEAELMKPEGLGSRQYNVGIRVYDDQSHPNQSHLNQQFARTRGTGSDDSESSDVEFVKWHEVFFFKVDSVDWSMLELTVHEIGRGEPVGCYSACLKNVTGSESENFEKADGRNRQFGSIQISPSADGPWTMVRLNYGSPSACWQLGNDLVASEVSVNDGNRYVSIRSLVSVRNNTDVTLDFCLSLQSANGGNLGVDKRNGSPSHGSDFTTDESQVVVGPIQPGDTAPLPLPCLSQSALYILHLKPSNLGAENYSWSSVVDLPVQSQDVESSKEVREIYISSLSESEKLLYCPETSGSSSNSLRGVWFCLSIQATEIAKDINFNPIQDWTIVVMAPVSITNYLPLMAEISLLEMQASGHFLSCYRGLSRPGESVNVYNVDIRNPLYFSLLPQRGWLPIHEAILLSHPTDPPSKTISLRSSVSGRIVQLILEHNHTNEHSLQPRIIKVYSPYWFGIARCPPLAFKLVDVGAKRLKKNPLSFQAKRVKEVILEEITEEETREGYTIASALNFKNLGLSASIGQSGGEQFGPVKDLTPLGDMDGCLDLFAYNADGSCMQLFVSSKPCPYQSIPTKVISVRPFMTFTNRVGQNLLLKFSSEDEPKTLRVSDTRVSFVHRKTDGPNKIQVHAHDTDWSFPIEIVKEDTFTLSLKKPDGTRRFLRTEIRGYEEGSRFIVVFRLGSVNGPIRIENRTMNKAMRVRQAGFGDDAWILLEPLSTANFCLEDPYGQRVIDVEVYAGDDIGIYKFDLDKAGLSSVDEYSSLFLHVVNKGDIKVVKFVDLHGLLPRSREASGSLMLEGNQGNTRIQAKMPDPDQKSPLELVVELGVIGISIVDHRPREIAYIYMEKLFISYSAGYDSGTTSRFKLVLGYLQLDNQLPLTVMPVLLAPEQTPDVHHPVFKMTITIRNENLDGLQIYPYIYIRVIDKSWRLSIHEPIIWALVDFYNNLQLDRFPQNSQVTQVDPEIRVDLIDISEVRLKVSLETAPAQRPHGLLGVWGPVLSAVGNTFKIQVHLRKVTHRDRFLRQSSVISDIGNRIWRDLIHNPLHLIFSVDVLGMTSSTLASLSKGFAELSTDGQFLQLRSKQVWSRRITGVGDGLAQGTEALAQGVAFGVSGVVRKPMENARQNGLLGLAHGLGQAFLGFFVQPVSGALDFFSLTVDGIGASCSRCLEILNNKRDFERIRNPRAFRADHVLREYSEREALGQMILYLAEASRNFGCTQIFKEPSKFAWSDCFEEHFTVPYQRIVLVTNRRVMLLQCVAPDKMDKKPCKILWDVPWEEIMALELAKAGHPIPSHLIIHLKCFKRGESFVRVIKCSSEKLPEESESQAVKICSVVYRMWKAHQNNLKQLPSSQRHVLFTWSDVDARESHKQHRAIITSAEISCSSSILTEQKFAEHSINFTRIWSSERESKGRCSLCRKQGLESGEICSIWRPVCPDGYVSIGDVARCGCHPPTVASIYRNSEELFVPPVGYDLVWRNCVDDYKSPVSIWHPRAPEGYFSVGCVAVPSFEEPEVDSVYCVAESLCEETTFEEQKIWWAPDSYPWACHIYQTSSDALQFVALRQPREESDWKPKKVIVNPQRSSDAW